MLRAAIKQGLKKLGYEVTRVPADDTSTRYSAFSDESKKERRFYNIGAAEFDHPLWTNIDFANEWYARLQKKAFISYNIMDLKPLPIASDSAEMFYCCQVVGHITDQAVGNLCNEVYRALKPGAVFRIVTPCIELEYLAYRRGDRDFFDWARAYPHVSLHRIFLGQLASSLSAYSGSRPRDVDPPSDAEIEATFSTLPLDEALNHFVKRCKFEAKYAGSHINWWTEKKLGSVLRNAGFSAVYRSGHGQSLAPPMRDLRYFDLSRNIRSSLYMEAIK